MGAEREYDVALSFAGEQRDYVEQVAALLRARGVRPFSDPSSTGTDIAAFTFDKGRHSHTVSP